MAGADKPVLLITRARAASESFAARFADRPDLRIVIAPLIEIVVRPLPAALDKIGSVALTSAHAVPALVTLARPHLPVFAVGPQTAAAIQAAGLAAEVTGETADDLVATLTANPPPEPVLHLHGTHTRGDVVSRLQAAGLQATGLVVYDQAKRDLTDEARAVLSGTAPVIAPLFSPRSARLFSDAVRGAIAPILPGAISRAAADAAGPDLAQDMTISAAPNRDAMIRAVLHRIETPSRLEAGRSSS